MNRLIKQQMRIFNVKIPYEKPRETYESRFLKYGRVEPVKLSLDEKFLDVADMVRRLGLNELHANKETEKIIKNPRKVCALLRLYGDVTRACVSVNRRMTTSGSGPYTQSRRDIDSLPRESTLKPTNSSGTHVRRYRSLTGSGVSI